MSFLRLRANVLGTECFCSICVGRAMMILAKESVAQDAEAIPNLALVIRLRLPAIPPAATATVVEPEVADHRFAGTAGTPRPSLNHSGSLPEGTVTGAPVWSTAQRTCLPSL